MPNHRIAHRVKLVELGSGPAQASAAAGAVEAMAEPTAMLVVMAAAAAGLAA